MVRVLLGLVVVLTLAPAGAQISITAPANGASLATPVTDVAVSFSSGNGSGNLIDYLELRANGQTVQTFDVPGGITQGSHTFAAVDLSSFSGSISLVARAFVGKKDKKFVDSIPVQVTIGTPDAIPPVISGLSPVNGSATNNPRPPIVAQVTDTGGSGVDPASITLQLDGIARVATITPGNPATVTFTPSADLGEGTHSFTLNAKDVAGNAAAPATSSFLVDRTPPTLAILDPGNGTMTTNPTPALTAQATDTGSGVDPTTLVLRLDGAPVNANTLPNGVLTFTPPNPLAPGPHTVTFDGRDNAGNPGTTASSTFTLILGAPVISITAPAPGSFTNNAKPPLAATVSSAGGAALDLSTIVVHVDGTLVLASVTPGDPAGVSFTPGAPLAPGSHIYTVDAKNVAAISAPTASTTFGIDQSSPAITIISPLPGAIVNSRRPLISASITDTGGAGFAASGLTLGLNNVSIPQNQLQITLSNNNQTALLSFTPPADLSDGTNVATVGATDRAGNTATTVSWLFVIDSIPPAISVASPDGTPVSTATVPLNATLSDLLTGVLVSSIHVTLNGAAQAVTLTPGAPGGFGAPMSVAITGTLTPQNGSNILAVSGSDLAGNAGTKSVLFDAGSGPPPPLGDILLTIVSGDGQQGLAGRGADQPLVVRATFVSNGSPVPGLPLVFSGSGTFARAAGRTSTLTDGGGTASVRYVFSTKPGANTVEVYVPGLAETAPVQFQLLGQLPTIATGEPPSPCNFGVSTEDFPGSALARLLTVKVTKPGGAALTGELVRPFVRTFNGQTPPLVKVGKFMPAKAFTDENGEARFAFVVDDGAPPGPFTMQFGMPEFQQPDGTEVHFDMDGRVRDPNNEFRGNPVIDSGQGQIGPLGNDTARPLKAKTSQKGGFIVFKVIEGNGTFTATANSDVRDASFTDCLKPIWLLAADDNGFAELNFRRTTDVALIEISPGSDVFAVGPHEVYFATTGRVEIPNLFPVNADQASSAVSFKVMTKVPKGKTPIVDLRSINSMSEETPTIQNAIAPTTLDNAALAMVLSGSTEEYDTYESREIIDTSQLNLPDGTVTPGGGFAYFESTDFGGAVAGVTIEGEERKFTIRNTSSVPGTKENHRPLFFNKRSPPTAAGELNKIRVSFKLGDAEALQNIHWTAGAVSTDNKKPEIFLTFKEADENGHEGTDADPLVVGIPEDKSNARKDVSVNVQITYKDKDGNATPPVPLKTTVRVALNKRMPDNSPSPGTKDQAGLLAIANWNPPPDGSPPIGSFGQGVFIFADATTAIPFIKDAIPAGVNLNANRLSFIDSLGGGAFATSYRDDISFQIYGAIMAGSLWDYPKDQIQGVIDHEAEHQKSAFDAQTNLTAYKALSQSLQATAGDRATLDAYLVCYDHSRIELNDLRDDRFSYRYMNDRNPVQTIAGRAGGEVLFIQAFNGVEKSLVEGENYLFIGTGRISGKFGLPGALQTGNLFTGLKSQMKSTYSAAVTAFPELQNKDEFDDSNKLVEPPK